MEENSELLKEKRIYTIELGVFALIFLVLGILLLIPVFHLKGTFRWILIYVSMAGSAWIIVDFFWTALSKKRRKKNSLLDKALALPAGISVLVFDILTFVIGFDETVEPHQVFVGILFCYLSVVYMVEAIYHWFKPVPMLLEDLPNENKDKKKDTRENSKEEPLTESEEDDLSSLKERLKAHQNEEKK